MLIDGLTLTSGSEMNNVSVETGASFPIENLIEGRLFYLTTAVNGNDPGLYIYNGSAWVTGDINNITAGTGLTGGGSSGSVTLSVNFGTTSGTVAAGDHSHQDLTGALDADLIEIANLSGNSGLLRKTAAETWSLDTNSYITGNQSITVTGDVSGSGTTSLNCL